MRDILRWVLHWFSSGEAITPPHVVTATVRIRETAAHDVPIRITATDEVEL